MKSIVTTNNVIVNYNHVVCIGIVDDADNAAIEALIPYCDETEKTPPTNIFLATGTLAKMTEIYKELVKFLDNEKKLLDFTKLDKQYDDAGVSKIKGAKHEVTTYKPSQPTGACYQGAFVKAILAGDYDLQAKAVLIKESYFETDGGRTSGCALTNNDLSRLRDLDETQTRTGEIVTIG